jgi:RNA polymerase sigma-70 factor, ECF subfamily
MPKLMQSDLTEVTLVQRVRRGDAEALGALFDLHGAALYQLAYRLLGTREDAEDAVQDVFGGLELALARYDEQGAFGAWLRRVTARTALMRLRAERRRRVDDPVRTHESADRGDVALRMTLDTALGTLPDPLRTVFVLRTVEGYSHDEIAGMLHISAGASKVRLHRAIRQLQQMLQGSL